MYLFVRNFDRYAVAKMVRSGEVTIHNILDLPCFKDNPKTKSNRIAAMLKARGYISKCLICGKEFKPFRLSRKQPTCSKSCGARYRYATPKLQKKIRGRANSNYHNGYWTG